MREMKDSGVEWIGEIPNNWGLVKLKYFYSFQKGINAAEYTKDYIGLNKGEFPVYSGQTENNGIMGYINNYDYDIDECLFTTTVGAKVMTPNILRGKFNLSQNCLIMIRTDQCSNIFVFYVLIALFDYEKSLIPSYMQPSLRIEDLKKYIFYMPTLQTQHRIADYLDRKCYKIDEIIENETKVIEKLKAYKQSVVTEAVTKGLNPDVPMKDSGIEWIGEVPEHWEIEKFKNYFNLSKGLSITKENLTETGTPVISYGQIHSKINITTGIKNELIRYVSPNYLESDIKCLTKENDLIFADTSEDLDGCGNLVRIDCDSDVFAGYHTIIAKNKIKNDSRYLAYLSLTKEWRSQIRCRVSGIKLFSITQKILKQLTIILPPLTEQQVLADYLDQKCRQIDETIAKKQATIEKLTAYKKSLIYEVVTGKKEV